MSKLLRIQMKTEIKKVFGYFDISKVCTTSRYNTFKGFSMLEKYLLKCRFSKDNKVNFLLLPLPTKMYKPSYKNQYLNRKVFTNKTLHIPTYIC